MPYRPWPRFSGCMKAGYPFIMLSTIAENFFEKFELRFFKNIHDLFTRISGPHSSTNFFTITAERLAGEVRKPITLECKKLHHLSTNSATNLDGTIKPLLSVFARIGGQKAPKSTPVLRNLHHFASKVRNLQSDAATIIREVSYRFLF